MLNEKEVKAADAFVGGDAFVLADVDTLPETAEHVRFTPTFTFYRKGRKVDEIAKIKPRALRDRMWMHADDPEEEPHK